jgi:hypothetical protein
MVAGPGVTGTPVASADVLGVGVNVFGHKDHKNNSDHHSGTNNNHNGRWAKTGRPGQPGEQNTRVGDQTGGQKVAMAAESGVSSSAPSGNALQSSTSSTGAPAGISPAEASASVTSDSISGVPVGVPQLASVVPVIGGGGGGAATSANIGRPPSLVPVPTPPTGRQIVIRAQPQASHSAPVAAPLVTQPPPVAAPVIPMLVPPVPAVLSTVPVVVLPGASGAGGVPAAPPGAPNTPHLPTMRAPQPNSPVSTAVPETFRAGYPDYLRAADTKGLLFVVLPGLAGMVLLTAAGGAAGFRQARAARALPPPHIARFLP